MKGLNVMKNLAIITARSGSKGLPDKNILPLYGKPLMWYSIKAALDSGMYDEVMVSTDSEKYAEIAKECGASVPFMRSAETASDTASSWDVVREVLREYKKLGKEFDTFTILQPTTPLRTAQDIRDAFALMEREKRDYVLGVIESEHPLGWYFSIGENNNREYPIDNRVYQRQAAAKYYRPNGVIYIMKPHVIVDNETVRTTPASYFIMDSISSIDIDSEADFVLAEYFLKKRQ